MADLITHLVFLLIISFLIMPFVLTIFNIINLVKKNKIKPKLFDHLTFILGIILTVVFYLYNDFKDYQEALRLGGLEVPLHAPIASWSMPTIYMICIIGIISFCIIRNKKLDLPPLFAVICMSCNLICMLFCVIFIIQISKNVLTNIDDGIFYFLIFPINYIICSLRVEKELIEYYKKQQVIEREYKSRFLNECNKALMRLNVNTWPFVAVVFSIPIGIILIGILILFGQRPDEIIKAFTETSDWTLSQMYSPPSVTYDAHYLCTVSLRGHKNIVKPLRYGIRRNEKIVVNRQLCIANAFEQLIEERLPKFHKLVRYIYDKYGYPISKHINTAIQADITYFIMKPLEWIFLIVLYLFDNKPENRIATQYLPLKNFTNDYTNSNR